MIDRDGRTGPYETRIKAAAQMVGVEYREMDADFLIRWQMTSYLRAYPAVSVPGS